MHSRNAGQFSVITAGSVTASEFVLTNAASVTVASLGTYTDPFLRVYQSISMYHLDATVGDSVLAWTTVPPSAIGSQILKLVGPRQLSPTGYSPQITLGVSTSSAARHSLTLFSGKGDFDTDAGATLELSHTVGSGASLTYSSNLGTTWRRFNITPSIASLEHDAQINIGIANTVGARNGGYVTLTAAGAQMWGSAITLSGTVTTTSNLTVNGTISLAGPRLTYHLVDQKRFTLAASASFGFQSFLMNGLVFSNVRANDLFIVTCSLRILYNVLGGAFIGLLAVYGPGGASVSDPARIIAENPPISSANTYSATWNHTATQGAGTYTFTIQGGSTGGTWTLVNPDTWFTVQHFTQS